RVDQRARGAQAADGRQVEIHGELARLTGRERPRLRQRLGGDDAARRIRTEGGLVVRAGEHRTEERDPQGEVLDGPVTEVLRPDADRQYRVLRGAPWGLGDEREADGSGLLRGSRWRGQGEDERERGEERRGEPAHDRPGHPTPGPGREAPEPRRAPPPRAGRRSRRAGAFALPLRARSARRCGPPGRPRW